MIDDLKRLSDHVHSGEELLEGLLHARDDAEIDALIECGQRWRGELIDLGETVDPIRLRFRVVRPTAEETARIWPLPPELRGDQRGYCYYLEAALWRLNIYLRQPDARSKGKGGNRRTLRREAAGPSSLAEKQCRKWLIEEMKARRAKRKTEYQNEALTGDRFPLLSDRGFLRAWDAAKKEPTTDPSWERRGPPGAVPRPSTVKR